jgi:hypothetical protein
METKIHSILAFAIFLLAAAFPVPAIGGSIDLPYSGRMVEDNGAPLAGPVDIAVQFFTSEESRAPIVPAVFFQTVPLDEGVFQLNIAFTARDFHKIFPGLDKQTWIQITDMSSGKLYPRQMLGTIPYALKVPVDGTTIGWNDNGELELRSDASVDKVAGESFVTKGAESGQVLAWDKTAKTWKPSSVASGTVTSVSSGAGLSGGVITAAGTLGIADAGVTATMLAPSAVTSTKIAVGAVSETAIADQSVTSVKVKDGTIARSDLDPTTCAPNEIFKVNGTGTGYDCATVGAGGGDIINNGQIGAVKIGTTNATALTMVTNNNPQITVNSAGLVGIGTTVPNSVLHVKGPTGVTSFTSTNQLGLLVDGASGGGARFEP